MKLCKDKIMKFFKKETKIDGLTFKNVEKKASLKSPLKAKKNPDHIYKKRGIFWLFFGLFFIFLAIFWSVWPNPITNLFRIFLQDISEALGLRLATVDGLLL